MKKKIKITLIVIVTIGLGLFFILGSSVQFSPKEKSEKKQTILDIFEEKEISKGWPEEMLAREVEDIKKIKRDIPSITIMRNQKYPDHVQCQQFIHQIDINKETYFSGNR